MIDQIRAALHRMQRNSGDKSLNSRGDSIPLHRTAYVFNERKGIIMRASLIIMIAIWCAGCGRIYHLPGHHSGNLNNPPNVILEANTSTIAVSTGMTLLAYPPPRLNSSNPDVVAITYPEIRTSDGAYRTPETAFLDAKQPGKTTVQYDPAIHTIKGENKGFTVAVVKP